MSYWNFQDFSSMLQDDSCQLSQLVRCPMSAAGPEKGSGESKSDSESGEFRVGRINLLVNDDGVEAGRGEEEGRKQARKACILEERTSPLPSGSWWLQLRKVPQ